MRRIRETDPPPIRSISRKVPEETVQVVRKALQKDPKDRYQTADDFARALRGESVPVWRRLLRRGLPVVGAAAAVLVIALSIWAIRTKVFV